jgi:hypothetical protein
VIILDNSKLIDRYFCIWAFFLPITSILIIPSLQGTTPAFMFALVGIFIAPIIGGKIKGLRFAYTLFITTSVLIFSVAMSQLSIGLYSGIIDLSKGILITIGSPEKAILFRSSVFTQSLYMTSALATFSFVRVFYNKKWDNYLLFGGVLLAFYGLYEFVYFLIFKTNGDFLSNRLFANGATGSSFQPMAIGGFTMERIKSLTGEPSMYAFTIMPFFLYSLYLKRKKTSLLLFLTLCLSSSTTFIVGLIFSLLFGIKYMIKTKLRLYLLAWSIVGFVLIAWPKMSDWFNQVVINKVTLQDNSGSDRFSTFQGHIDLFSNLPFMNKLFGIGFGTVRSTDFFSTLLVNTGIFGILAFSSLFMYPVFKMNNDKRGKMIKLIILITYMTMMISVSEYSYLPTWLFLGIAYNKIYSDKHSRFVYKVQNIEGEKKKRIRLFPRIVWSK